MDVSDNILFMDTPTAPQPVSTQAPQIIQSHCQCPHCRRRGWGLIGGFLKLIGFIVLLACVFAAGAFVGGIGWGSSIGGTRMMGGFDGAAFDAPMMLSNGSVRFGNERFGAGERLFGVVRTIVGTKLTIVDNGGGTQTVVVSASTTISNGSIEVPAASLRVGQSLCVWGALKDGVVAASFMQIVQ